MKRLLVIPALLACLTATACFGGATAVSTLPIPSTGPATTSASGGTPPSAQIVDTVRINPCRNGDTQGCAVLVHHYSLNCGLRPTGSMPNPTAACAAIADLRHQSVTSGGTSCIGVLSGNKAYPPTTASLTGRFHGARINWRFDASSSWCNKSLPVLRDLWTLSTFPCNTPVLHSAANSNAGSSPTESWARRTGCTTSAPLAPTA